MIGPKSLKKKKYSQILKSLKNMIHTQIEWFKNSRKKKYSILTKKIK